MTKVIEVTAEAEFKPTVRLEMPSDEVCRMLVEAAASEDPRQWRYGSMHFEGFLERLDFGPPLLGTVQWAELTIKMTGRGSFGVGLERERNAAKALARKTDGEPSRRSAEDIAKNAQPLERKVMGFALSRPDFTQWELEVHFNNHGPTYRSRVAPLVDAGYLIETERTRENGNGREVTVFTAQGAKPWPHGID